MSNFQISAPKDVDKSIFAPDVTNLNPKFGLPSEVRFCKSCVISNQRPNSAVEYAHAKSSKKETIAFDEHGICDACRFADKKQAVIDWDERELALRDLLDRYRSTDGSYDCLVPGSGGKDSFYASHILKTKYGMHPLTVTWAPHIYTDWGWKNFQRWIHAGHDNYLMTPNGRVHRLLTRLAVDNLFHPFQPFMMGQKAIAPKMAMQFNIPLVFYGENEAEYGNPISDNNTAERDKSYFTTDNFDDLSIGGISVPDLKTHFGLEQHDLAPYLPPDSRQVVNHNVEVHYLGYYLKWHPQSCYYYSVEHGGFEASPERTSGTYSKYNSIDDRIDDFHFYTYGVKFGIARATYDASQEIRSRDITRDEGVALVKRFDHEYPERFAEEIFDYLSIPENEFPEAFSAFEQPIFTRDYFRRLADNFRSPHLWMWDDDQWKLRHAVWH